LKQSLAEKNSKKRTRRLPRPCSNSRADIVVTCPGRLLDLISEPGVFLKNMGTMVLDEADHMFNRGFLPDIKRIIHQMPQKRQNLIFSATMPKEIERLIDNILINSVKIQIRYTGTRIQIAR
jgi:ATP-dependent RNA helicase RhlE